MLQEIDDYTKQKKIKMDRLVLYPKTTKNMGWEQKTKRKTIAYVVCTTTFKLHNTKK